MIAAALIAAELVIITVGAITAAVVGTRPDRQAVAAQDLAEIDAWLQAIQTDTTREEKERLMTDLDHQGIFRTELAELNRLADAVLQHAKTGAPVDLPYITPRKPAWPHDKAADLIAAWQLERNQ